MLLSLVFFILSGIGAGSRYLLNTFLIPHPLLSTAFVNLTGSLLIGLLYSLFHNQLLPSSLFFILTVGFLGSFTTFSTLIFHAFELIRQAHYFTAFFYLMLHNILGVSFCFLGFFLGKNFT